VISFGVILTMNIRNRFLAAKIADKLTANLAVKIAARAA